MSIDPRIFIIPKRLSVFKCVVPILSPKGGVGKTTIAVALSTLLSEEFGVTSFLDLDINNPTAHIALGLDTSSTTIHEDKGVIPIKLLDSRLEFMSVALFTKDKLLPLRGKGISNAIIEMLSIVRWSGNILIVDTPPGFSDEVMELIRLSPSMKALLVSTVDKMSLLSVKRVINVLKDEGINIIGVVGNMCRDNDDIEALRKFVESLGIEILACVPWIDRLYKFYGDIHGLKNILRNHLLPVVNKLGQCL